jgi:hypothetical protein
MAIVAPPNNKAAARTVRAVLVMIFSMPIPKPPEETSDRHKLFPDPQ